LPSLDTPSVGFNAWIDGLLTTLKVKANKKLPLSKKCYSTSLGFTLVTGVVGINFV